MIKRLFAAVVVLAVIAGGIAAYLYANRGSVATRATDRVLTYVLGVEVAIEGMDVRPRQGRVEVDRLAISNPNGFETRRAFQFDAAVVETDLRSFRTETPVIRLLSLREPKIVYEKKLQGKSNLAQLIENASRFKQPEAEPQIDDLPEEAPEGAGKRMRIERLEVEGAEAALSTPLLRGTELVVPLPAIEMTNLEGTPDELARQFLIEIARQVGRAGGSRLPSDFEMPEAAEFGGRLREEADRLREGLRSGDLEGTLEQGGRSLRGLLGGTREEPAEPTPAP